MALLSLTDPFILAVEVATLFYLKVTKVILGAMMYNINVKQHKRCIAQDENKTNPEKKWYYNLQGHSM